MSIFDRIFGDDTDEILAAIGGLDAKIRQLLAQGDRQMATLQELQNKLGTILTTVGSLGSSLSNIAADIERIKGSLAGGLTPAEGNQLAAELDAAQTQLQGVADAAKNLAESNPDPEPTPEG